MVSTDAEEAFVMEARRREGVIAPLAELERVSVAAARTAGERLGLAERIVYALLRRYRASGRLLSSLAPRRSLDGRGKGRLAVAAERVIAEAMQDQHLARQKRRVEAVVRAVRKRCRTLGLKPPSANTVRARVRRVRADLVASRREGARSPAARRLAPVVGAMPVPGRPMQVVQMDHTLVDLVTVDEAHRRPVGRPCLSVVIDVRSRCIAGLHLSCEAPSAASVGLCLTHAALGKEAYLRGLGLDPAAWPVQGRPAVLHVDNGVEFHSEALARGCAQHGIELRYRPVGAPHHGGIVERLIGTLMALIHELPGTTFSNPAERGAYDSDASACLTLAELGSAGWCWRSSGPTTTGATAGSARRRWRAGARAWRSRGCLLRSRTARPSSSTSCRSCAGGSRAKASWSTTSPPSATWLAALDLAARGARPLRDRDHDPRDLSRIWVLDPVGQAYVEVPCSRQERPRITLFEHRQARAELRAEGRAQVDEEAIFRAVEPRAASSPARRPAGRAPRGAGWRAWRRAPPRPGLPSRP